MATFVYNALDPNGKSVKGKIEAESEQLVLAKLHEQRFHIVSVSETKASAKMHVAAKTHKVKLQSLVVFSRQFATMIDAGIPIIKCLDILENQTKEEGLKGVINATPKDVKGGLSLTDAISKHGHVFNKL